MWAVVRQAKGWPPAQHRMVWLGQVLTWGALDPPTPDEIRVTVLPTTPVGVTSCPVIVAEAPSP
jgi:hypothetical protein